MLRTLQHLVRDEGVAASNPATPTNTSARPNKQFGTDIGTDTVTGFYFSNNPERNQHRVHHAVRWQHSVDRLAQRPRIDELPAHLSGCEK